MTYRDFIDNNLLVFVAIAATAFCAWVGQMWFEVEEKVAGLVCGAVALLMVAYVSVDRHWDYLSKQKVIQAHELKKVEAAQAIEKRKRASYDYICNGVEGDKFGETCKVEYGRERNKVTCEKSGTWYIQCNDDRQRAIARQLGQVACYEATISKGIFLMAFAMEQDLKKWNCQCYEFGTGTFNCATVTID